MIAPPTQIRVVHDTFTEVWDVLASAWVHEGGSGWLPTMVIMARCKGRKPHPYVVWDAVYKENALGNGGWQPGSGFYAADRADAWDNYSARARFLAC